MELTAYLTSLSFLQLFSRMPAAAAQGILWGLMALGVFITFRVLDIADLTVDGSFATGGAVTVMLLLAGWPAWAALLAALAAGVLTGLVTGELHTRFGIPVILSGILTQFALYSINLRIMTKANQTASIGGSQRKNERKESSRISRTMPRSSRFSPANRGEKA